MRESVSMLHLIPRLVFITPGARHHRDPCRLGLQTQDSTIELPQYHIIFLTNPHYKHKSFCLDIFFESHDQIRSCSVHTCSLKIHFGPRVRVLEVISTVISSATAWV